MAEQTFFNQDGISVTNTRVVIGGQTYAMSGITSVRSIEETPSRKGPIILGVVGILPLFAGEVGPVLFGLLLIGIAVAWFIAKKPTYFVGLVTASGESRALTSKDSAYISKIVNAINEAIIARG